MLRHVFWYILTDVSEDPTAAIIRVITAVMIEEVRPSERSVSIYQIIWRSISEVSHIIA
jgi:hypothetical protein